MDKCKYCGSSELELENKTKFSVMDAPQVALKCAKCGKWLKWCPKDERKYYLGEFKKIAQKSNEIQIEELQKQLFNKEQEIERLRDKISDLEAKLAESEKPKEIRFNGFVIDCNYDEARNNLQKEILKMQEENNELRKSQELQTYAQNILEINQLKQQLAEKDKEIKELLNYDRCSHCSYGQANKEYREKCSELIEELAEVKNSCDYYMNRANDLLLKDQDKISFCIEQLEKVKAELVNKVSPVKLSYNEYVQGVFSKIDNQIKQLKEMK